MELPAQGAPHVNVERAEILQALAAVLPDDAITYGARCTDVAALASDHDLVVIADGASSALRPAVTGPPRRQWTWTVWQACVTAELPEVPAGAGVSVIRPGFFSGVWRLPRGRITWFVEQPERQPGAGGQLLADLKDDADPVLRTLAEATADEQWIQWRARDIWPRRPLHRGNVVLVGDAAHATLPTLGQGSARMMARSGGPVLRRITRPVITVPG